MFRQSFRAWLSERLMDTRWATTPIPDERIEEVARRLGVDPELLLEVRAEARIRAVETGRPVPAAVSARHRRLYQFHIYMPVELHALWSTEAERRGVEGPTLLRSLIHGYLLGGREPANPLRGWRWRGRHYRLPAKNRGELERAVIPQGAKRALARRAAMRGTTSMALVRALILEVLEGQHRGLRYVEAKMMYDDEKRYFLGAA